MQGRKEYKKEREREREKRVRCKEKIMNFQLNDYISPKIFNDNFRLIIYGNSNTGKTFLLKKIILNQKRFIGANTLDKIYYCTKHTTSVDDELREHVTVIIGLPSDEIIENQARKRILICLDDLSSESFSSKNISSLFTDGRHSNVSIILLLQNFFTLGKFSRSCHLSCSHIIILKCLRDLNVISTLSRQMSPQNPSFLTNLYNKYINKEPYKHLLISLQVADNDLLRFRSDILNQEYCEIFMSADQFSKLNHEVYQKENDKKVLQEDIEKIHVFTANL